MSKKSKRRFFAKHSKSSAAVVALALHAVFIVVGLSVVVISSVIDPGFQIEAPPPVERKSVPAPKLRPPSNEKQAAAARPRFKRFEVRPRLDRDQPVIALPEMSGASGDLGSASGGGGDALGSMVFVAPEFKIFDVRGKGEKIFLILDCGDHMLEDRMGGIPAYTIIKNELIRIVDELPPTAVFNVCVFGSGQTWTLFPNLVPATEANAARVGQWLAPLNAAESSVQTGRYGVRTLGSGGIRHKEDLRRGAFAESVGEEEWAYRPDRWFTPAMVAMAQRADTVFLLTNTWGSHRRVAGEASMTRAEWLETSDGKRWTRAVAEAREMHAEENRRRAERGEPPRVIANGAWGLVAAYKPGTPRPPRPSFTHFTPRDFKDAFKLLRAEERKTRKLKDPYTFNVIRFTPTGASAGSREDPFKKLVGLCGGGYQTIAGLEAIKSYLEKE